MDINDLTSSTNTTPTPTPVVSQSNTPIYSAPDTYPVPPANPSTNQSSGNYFSFLSSINWVEVTFMGLGALALFYTIDYYRFKMKEDKASTKLINRRIDKLEANFAALQTPIQTS